MAEPSTPIARRIWDGIQRLVAGSPERVVSFDPTDLRFDQMTATEPGNGRRRKQPEDRYATVFQTKLDRRGRLGDFREMDREVPPLHRARQVLISFVFGGALDEEGSEPRSFVLRDGDARPEIQAALTRLVERLRLHRQVRSVLGEGLLLGDSFSEMNYLLRPNGTGELISLIPIWCELVEVREILGFVDTYRIGGQEEGEDRSLAPFQVLHYSHRPERGCRYGTSLYESGRKRWRTGEAVEDVLGLMALTSPRERMTHLWPFPDGLDDDEIWEWQSQIQAETEHDWIWDTGVKLQKRVVPQLETADLILPYKAFGGAKGGEWAPTTVTRAAADLGQLVKVLEFFQDSYFITTGVPAALAGYDRSVNAKATLDGQLQGFSLTVREDQGDAAEIVRDVLTRGLLAEGIVPLPDEFEVVMPAPSEFDRRLRAEVAQIRASAAATLLQAGLPPDFVLRRTLDVAPEEADEIALAMVQGQTAAAVESLGRTTRLIADREMALPGVSRRADPDAPALGHDVPWKRA